METLMSFAAVLLTFFIYINDLHQIRKYQTSELCKPVLLDRRCYPIV